MSKAGVPSHSRLFFPTLQAVKALGGSGRIDEIDERVIELEGFTEAQQSIPHGTGPRSELQYRLAWARTYLGWFGALENSARGVWSITDSGRSLREEEVARLHAEFLKARRLARTERRKQEQLELEQGTGVDDGPSTSDWKGEGARGPARALRQMPSSDSHQCHRDASDRGTAASMESASIAYRW